MTPYYQCDSATIYLGDCLEIMPQLDGPFDAIIADNPYGTTACAWDSVIPLEPMWDNYKRLIKPTGAVVLFGSQPFTSMLVMSNLEWFKYELVWDKGRGFEPQLANIRPQKSHENILVFCNGVTIYNPQMRPIDKTDFRRASGRLNNRLDGNGHNILSSVNYEDKIYTERYPLSISFFENANQKSKQHPTQKPTKLIEYLLKTYSSQNDIILDNAMGSGTTAIACQNTNRRFVGIETDQKYVEIAVKRIEENEQRLNSMLIKPWQDDFEQIEENALVQLPISL